MFRDRHKSRFWKKKLGYCNAFGLIRCGRSKDLTRTLCRNKWGRNFMGEEEGWTPAHQYPSKLIKLGIIAGPRAVPRCCHSQSLSRSLALAVSTGSEVWCREGKTPRMHSLNPESDFHLSWGLVGSTVTKLLWKEREEGDYKQKEQLKFTFYVCFLLRKLLLWVKSAETSQVIAAWIFKPGYKYLGFFFNSDYCLCFLPIYSPLI